MNDIIKKHNNEIKTWPLNGISFFCEEPKMVNQKLII